VAHHLERARKTVKFETSVTGLLL